MNDLGWLKEEVDKHSEVSEGDKNDYLGLRRYVRTDLVEELINQVEQPEITYEQALSKLAERYPFSSASIGAILEGDVKNGKYEPELPVVPDFIDEQFNLMDASGLESEFSNVTHILAIAFEQDGVLRQTKLFDWVRKNPGKYVMAAKYGYTVEEKKYEVVNNANEPFLHKHDGEVEEYREGFVMLGETQLTEQEINDYDPRYWAFAIPVDDVE